MLIRFHAEGRDKLRLLWRGIGRLGWSRCLRHSVASLRLSVSPEFGKLPQESKEHEQEKHSISTLRQTNYIWPAPERGLGQRQFSKSSSQLTLFCDIEAVHFLGASARSNASGDPAASCISSNVKTVIEEILAFREFGRTTEVLETVAATFGGQSLHVPTYVNEFWTSKQRAAHSLHEISYRACFKPQLPRFLITRLTHSREAVYDPFMGRGTTLIEAALLGRIPFGCDINPVGLHLCRPRLDPPTFEQVTRRLAEIDFADADEMPEDLLVFFHRDTLREICALKKYLLGRQANSRADSVDRWICMVALNRLTGHSRGFFSVYSMPPNQAVSVQQQKQINQKRGQVPQRKHVATIIAKKTKELLVDCDDETRRVLASMKDRGQILTANSSTTPEIASGSISLVVTSPPFLDVVDYAGDNWLRTWFIGVDPASVQITITKKLEDWQHAMTFHLREMHRVLRPGGHLAFEVGEVRGGRIKLEEAALPCGEAAGFSPKLVLINDQWFTKTAACRFGVENNVEGTNTNRVVLFRKDK